MDEVTSVRGDLNGDGAADVAVGVPRLFLDGHPNDGGVDVYLSDGGRQQITLDTLPGSGGEQLGARFGGSVSTADFDADACDDLAVGAPGMDGKGAVFLLFGSRLGVRSAGAVRIVAPDGATGDGFGSTVVAEANEDGPTDLWVGAPGREVSGLGSAGEVYHFTVDRSLAVSLVGTINYDTTGVPGSPAAGDHFGEVLAESAGWTMVGVPRRSVQGHPGAGEVIGIRGSTYQQLNQASAGMPGAPEDGDHFGAAIADRAVGVPGEDIGKVKDAGSVQIIVPNGALTAGPSLSEDSPGVPGAAEAGDQFGASLAFGTWYLCQEEGDLAIGAPGESIGHVAGAGAVTVVGILSEGKPCAARTYRQGTTLAGALAAGNHVGASLATLSGNPDDEEDQRDGVAIGVPGRDGSSRNTGAVITGLASANTVLTAVGGQAEDQEFGKVLASVPQ